MKKLAILVAVCSIVGPCCPDYQSMVYQFTKERNAGITFGERMSALSMYEGIECTIAAAHEAWGE